MDEQRFIQEFAVIAYREAGLSYAGTPCYQLKLFLPDENRSIWGCQRDPLEVQLIKAGVMLPAMYPQQEIAWNRLKSLLVNEAGYPLLDVQQVLHEECRNAILHGLADEVESKISVQTLMEIKSLIPQIGEDLFSISHRWYFDANPPQNSHLFDE